MFENDLKILTEKSVVSEVNFAKLFPDIYKRVVDYSTQFNISDWREMKYLYMNQIKDRPVCVICGKPVKFRSVNKGYTDTCSRECDLQLKSQSHKKIWNGYTKEEKTARVKQMEDTREAKTGYRTPFANPDTRKQIEKTMLERYGTLYYISEEGRKNFQKKMEEKREEIDVKISKSWSEKTQEEKSNINQKRAQTCVERFGVYNYSKTDEFHKFMSNTTKSLWQNTNWLDKVKNTNLERYGVMYSCLAKHVQDSNGKQISQSNKEFAQLLEESGIKNVEVEFSLKKYSYDVKVRDTLIEIDPSYTHNSTIGPYFHGKHLEPKDKDYHQQKTKFAQENGYQCIHVWDWDQLEKVIYMLSNREKIYARECEVKEVNLETTKEFLNLYHLQNSCRNQEIRLGLYYKEQLVEVMTFGNPRYNSKYQWELLRLCTRPGYIVVGGANKLFTYFIEQYKPTSVISYCDNSKFDGTVYYKLGMKYLGTSKPTSHWYNIKTKQHITDNLLRQRGADQLLGTKYGKGTSNKDIMLAEGFVEVYDCGQSTFVWTRV